MSLLQSFANYPTFKKGDRVIVSPVSYPTSRWYGEILRKSKLGYRVTYEVNGVMMTDTFSPKELTMNPLYEDEEDEDQSQ